RSKEVMITQGIEMQRRWICDIGVHSVRQEHGGRLAKLNQFATHLERLMNCAVDVPIRQRFHEMPCVYLPRTNDQPNIRVKPFANLA
ncbi:hypothetical protein F4604DRAFT_1571419, partial [Suillus subluteus]